MTYGMMEKMMLMKSERYLIKKIIEKFVKICLFSISLGIGLTFIMGSYHEENVYTLVDSITIELGEKLPEDITRYMGIINNFSNLELVSNVILDEEGRTLVIGSFNYYLVYNDNDYRVSRLTNNRSTIKVVDTTKPIIKVNDDKTFEYGKTILASDIAKCEDLSGCTLSLDKEIDPNTSGEFEVMITAIDGAKNKSYTLTTITIKEKPKPVYNYYVSYNNQANIDRNNSLTEEQKENMRYEVLEFAKKFIGNPYVYGGTSLTNGADCSGFTMSIYANFGYTLPRIATNQGGVGISVSAEELLPGDLVVYYYENGGGHVGIYAGNGMMIHAGTEKTGIVMAPLFSGYKIYRRVIY